MATHSSILAWKTPWTEESGGLQSMGFQRVRRDWSNLALTYMTVMVNCGLRKAFYDLPVNPSPYWTSDWVVNFTGVSSHPCDITLSPASISFLGCSISSLYPWSPSPVDMSPYPLIPSHEKEWMQKAGQGGIYFLQFGWDFRITLWPSSFSEG